MRPMLATPGVSPPDGPQWCHEVKWDGVRALVEVADGRVRVTTRNGNDVTAALPELAELVVGRDGSVVDDVLLDGELVVLVDGRPSFSAAVSRVRAGSRRAGRAGAGEPREVLLIVFDLLRLAGRDLVGAPLRERRELLESLTFTPASVQCPPVHADGKALWEATLEQGLEGIVSKRWSSRYEPGVRSRAWMKFPHRARTSWVVGGWRPEEGAPGRLGSLLVGAPTAPGAGGEAGAGGGTRLRYRGRVGSGFSVRRGAELVERLAELSAPESPFGALERGEREGVHWVRPELVVDVESLGLTGGGRLRQPRFVAVRDDLDAREVGEVDEP